MLRYTKVTMFEGRVCPIRKLSSQGLHSHTGLKMYNFIFKHWNFQPRIIPTDWIFCGSLTEIWITWVPMVTCPTWTNKLTMKTWKPYNLPPSDATCWPRVWMWLIHLAAVMLATPTCTGQRRYVSFNICFFLFFLWHWNVRAAEIHWAANVSRQKPGGRQQGVREPGDFSWKNKTHFRTKQKPREVT